MKSFNREFLNEDLERVPGAPRVYVAAFGKHPAWDDHMDDMGLLTESLVEAKRCLYVQGVSSQIESGAWDRLDAENALVGFDHIFIWHRPGETIVGLIWASRDGKGRALYPMVLCAHVVAQPLEWIWSEVLPRLEAAAAACRDATTQKNVIVAMNTAQEALRRRSMPGRVPPGAGAAAQSSALGAGPWTAQFARDQDALRRVCHHLATHVGALALSGGTEPDARSRALRLPTVRDATPAESLNAWLRFLAGQIDPFWPMLLFKVRAGEWVDAIVGEPAKDDFFRLRAAPVAEPLVSDIPYNLTDDFERRLDGMFTDVTNGRMPQTSFLSGESGEEMLGSAAQRLRVARRTGPQGFLSRLLNGGSR